VASPICAQVANSENAIQSTWQSPEPPKHSDPSVSFASRSPCSPQASDAIFSTALLATVNSESCVMKTTASVSVPSIQMPAASRLLSNDMKIAACYKWGK
jgi:hypothetical protein